MPLPMTAPLRPIPTSNALLFSHRKHQVHLDILTGVWTQHESADVASRHTPCLLHTPPVPDNCLQTTCHDRSARCDPQTPIHKRQLTRYQLVASERQAPPLAYSTPCTHVRPSVSATHVERCPRRGAASHLHPQYNRKRFKRLMLHHPLRPHPSRVCRLGDAFENSLPTACLHVLTSRSNDTAKSCTHTRCDGSNDTRLTDQATV